MKEILLVLMEALVHQKKSLVLILVKQRRYNDDNSYLFVNEKKICKFKANNRNVNFSNYFFQGSISNKFDHVEAEEVYLKGNVHDFSVD